MAQPGPDEAGMLVRWGGIIFGAAVATATSVFGFLFHRVIQKHDEEIAAIKKGIADVDVKLDGKVDKEIWEQNRREQRDNVVRLHEKVEQIARDGETRHRELVHILMERRDTRRSGD